MLNTSNSQLFAPNQRTAKSRRLRYNTAHVDYLNKLAGQACTAKKWRELLLKSLRLRPSTADSNSLDEAVYSIEPDELSRGDVVYFRARPRGPSYGVIAQKLKGGTFLGVSLIGGKIREFRLNIRRRHSRRQRGRIINSFVRTVKVGDSSPGYLAGELAHRFARPR